MPILQSRRLKLGRLSHFSEFTQFGNGDSRTKAHLSNWSERSQPPYYQHIPVLSTMLSCLLLYGKKEPQGYILAWLWPSGQDDPSALVTSEPSALLAVNKPATAIYPASVCWGEGIALNRSVP